MVQQGNCGRDLPQGCMSLMAWLLSPGSPPVTIDHKALILVSWLYHHFCLSMSALSMSVCLFHLLAESHLSLF